MGKLYEDLSHYYPEQYSDGEHLQHWKYIKRERVNGKWRYYYKDTKYDDIKRERDRAREDHEFAKDYSSSLSRFVGYYTNQLDEKNGGDKQATDNDPNLKGWKEMRDKAAEESRTTYQKYKSIDKKYQRAVEKYSSSAGHKVADILNDASDVINKGQDWLKKHLGIR